VTALPRFVLASASPARLATLRNAGVDPEVIVSGVGEDDVTGSAAEVAATLAERKALAVADRFDDALVLGCDSVLELDGETFGKPASAADALARWRRMSGRVGVLHTGHVLVDTTSHTQTGAVASTTVHFARLTDAEMTAYVDSGEPLVVAGAFTIDGLGGPFVERIEGDPHNVVGLSLPLLRHLLDELGHRWIDRWRPGTSKGGS
jgi:septum formation protein